MVGLERLLIGRTLDGRYTIEELIGQGRSGLVYRARHAHTGVEVALKVVAAPRTPEARERFRTLVAGEVRLAAAIEHVNVAGVYCLGHDAELDLDFVTAELLRGQTLASVLSQRGKPPIALGLRLLAEAAEGMAAGHAAGLVHRDLRPASLYLVRPAAERQVRVKVAGFGVPQLVRRESLAGAAPEVSAYASPELLAAGSLRLTPASDVFSLGVVGYELLTGRLPFDEAARRALAEGGTVEAEHPGDVADSVPPQVVDAVLQALRCAPAERHANGAAFQAALQQPVRHVVAVGKIAPAAHPAPEAPAPAEAPEAVAETPAPAPHAGAIPVAAAAVSSDVPVVDVADLAVDEPEPDVPDLAAAAVEMASAGKTEPDVPDLATDEAAATVEVASLSEAVEPAAAASAEPAPVAVEAPAVLTFAEVPTEITPAAAGPAVVEPVAATEALPVAATAPVPPVVAAPPPRDLTRGPAPKAAPSRAAAAPDLELYYPPQAPKPPVAIPAAFSPPPAPPVVEPPAVVAAPIPVETAPPAAIPVSRAPIAETPAPAPTPAPLPAPAKLKLTPGAARKRPAAGSATYRGPAMAAGFVLGILVLGSVAWVATHAGGEPVAPQPAAVANQLVSGSATPAATPAQAAASQQPARAPLAAATADTAARTAEQRAADARKKQQDDERRRLEEERTRQAQLLQQQQLAAQQAAARQPAPVQPQPQQVAVAPQPRPAAQPAAPPPAPPPAPAREEPAASAPSANHVFDEDIVEERPRLTNGSELQRSLQDRYPAQLYANRVSGSVTATFVVGADGRVDPGSISIVNSPHPGFNAPTQGVLRRARFRPARVKGQPVRVQVTMPIAWTIAQ
jgi:serine/threonine-protein kinase